MIALLKSVAYGWRQAAVAENAATIRDIGQELYRRLGNFTGHLGRLGKKLDDAVEIYNEAVGSLERQVLPQARRFPELGVSGESRCRRSSRSRSSPAPTIGAAPSRSGMPPRAIVSDTHERFDPREVVARADELRGRVIAVTGASDGIGRAVALACAQHGAEVVLIGRSAQKLQARACGN